MMYQTYRSFVKSEALDAVVEGVNKIVSVFCTYLNRLRYIFVEKFSENGGIKGIFF
jgi:hypothetical protein